MMAKIPDLPPELWDEVVSHLSPLSGSAAAEAFRFERTTERRSHASIWQAFFKKESWAAIVTSDFANQLILLGADLLKLYDDCRHAIQKLTNVGLIIRDRHRETFDPLVVD
jgi:hypothetical protein